MEGSVWTLEWKGVEVGTCKLQIMCYTIDFETAFDAVMMKNKNKSSGQNSS